MPSAAAAKYNFALLILSLRCRCEIFLQVSNNGLDFTADRVTYTVEHSCPGGSFCLGPDTGSILPCPQVDSLTVHQNDFESWLRYGYKPRTILENVA